MPSLDTSITITVNGASYIVWDEGVEEVDSWNGESSSVVWTLLCAWADRVALKVNLLYVGGRHSWPGNASLLAQDIRTKGVGTPSVDEDSGLIAYPWARLTITFRYPDPIETGSEDLETSIHGIALDQDAPAFKWNSDNVPLPPTAMPVLEFTTMHVVEEFYSTTLNKTLYGSLVDHCNSGTFLGFAAEKIIYRGLHSHRRLATGGDTRWHLQQAFELHVPATWNQLYRPGTGWSDFVRLDGSKLFPTADLSSLLT